LAGWLGLYPGTRPTTAPDTTVRRPPPGCMAPWWFTSSRLLCDGLSDEAGVAVDLKHEPARRSASERLCHPFPAHERGDEFVAHPFRVGAFHLAAAFGRSDSAVPESSAWYSTARVSSSSGARSSRFSTSSEERR